MPGVVLIVDDEPISRNTIEAILEGEGYTIEMAENGQQALEKAHSLLPDVILLDVMMPGMSGYEVCRQIRDDNQLAEISIVMVTALDDRDSLLQGLEVGADEFLTKPFDRHELRARLRGITRLNRFRNLKNERARTRQALKDLSTANDDTLKGWALALELRDKETEGHSQRVVELTVHLARALGLSEEDIVTLRRGALLHDIGKIGIPDAILHKPGALNDEEWAIMKEHPDHARNMLQSISYLQSAMDIPYSHHERWNGSGYPRGLKGEEIPLPARLFAIVDAWDALTSDRPYREAWSPAKTSQYLLQQSGILFDPKIVAVFLKLYGGK
ncbi:MAG: response regulator [Chloroflexi bacterium]|nr:response regulator [Chloroflexota bacterium]